MPRSPRAETDRLIEALHQERLRVWSIVITFFGDAVVPRGGEVWLSVVSALMDRLAISSGTLGAAMSRLTAENWLVRVKDGRRSRYQLAEAGKQAFEEAAQRIYGLDGSRWTGAWSVWVLGEADGQTASAWRARGFGQLGPTTFVRAEEAPERPVPQAPSATRVLAVPHPAHPVGVAEQAWPIADAESRNAGFIQAFAPLEKALEGGEPLGPEDAMAARTLLIHAFRRVSLRDPRLPPNAIPTESARTRARELTGNIYRKLLERSEAWLDAHAEGGLEPPEPQFYERFGGLQRLSDTDFT